MWSCKWSYKNKNIQYDKCTSIEFVRFFLLYRIYRCFCVISKYTALVNTQATGLTIRECKYTDNQEEEYNTTQSSTNVGLCCLNAPERKHIILIVN